MLVACTRATPIGPVGVETYCFQRVCTIQLWQRDTPSHQKAWDFIFNTQGVHLEYFELVYS